MSESAQDVVVRDNPDRARYEAWVGGRLAAFTAYGLAGGDRIVFRHTQTDAAFEGRGVASALARGALDDARARGLAIVPRCPFVRGFIARHREYEDLVAN